MKFNIDKAMLRQAEAQTADEAVMEFDFSCGLCCSHPSFLRKDCRRCALSHYHDERVRQLVGLNVK